MGSVPELLLRGCLGEDERTVLDELGRIIEEVIDPHHLDGKTLPPATSGRDFANWMEHVA